MGGERLLQLVDVCREGRQHGGRVACVDCRWRRLDDPLQTTQSFMQSSGTCASRSSSHDCSARCCHLEPDGVELALEDLELRALDHQLGLQLGDGLLGLVVLVLLCRLPIQRPT